MPTVRPCLDCGGRSRGIRCRTCWMAHAASVPGWRAGTRPSCSVDECGKPHSALGYCEKHLARFKRHGSADVVLKIRGDGPATCVVCEKRCKVPGTMCRRCWAEGLVTFVGCQVVGCEEKHHTKGYCVKHHHRVSRHGSPHGGRLRSAELVRKLPQPEGRCVNWPYLNSHGYGVAMVGNRKTGAYRLAWETHRGPIPAGMEIDHLCCNRACVNVNHLEPVTGYENKRRRWIRWWARQEA